MQRIVVPELLDSLPAEDPEAIRSRADLRVLNGFMGSERWIIRELEVLDGVKRVVELGAGEGKLSTKIKRTNPELEVVAVDLIDKPDGVEASVEWRQSNVLIAELPIDSETVVVANLFLHHFEEEALRQLGEQISQAKALLFTEPARHKCALGLGYIVYPFVSRVTKHDMIVSIKAGFMPSELPAYFSEQFEWRENVHPMGGLRSRAVIV